MKYFFVQYFCTQSSMFYCASAFNQDIGNWNMSSGTNFISIIVFSEDKEVQSYSS